MLYYTCAKVYADIALKNKSVGVLLLLQVKQQPLMTFPYKISRRR